MKKFLVSLLCAYPSLGLLAQDNYQIPNSDFEAEWSVDANDASKMEPGSGWYSFKSAAGTFASMAPNITSKVAGYNSTNAVLLKSIDLYIAKANGNLTTGKINMGSIKPEDHSNYNYTSRSTTDGNCPFVGFPDTATCYVKFKRGGSGYNAAGTFLIHGDADYRDPYETDDNKAKYLVAKAVIDIVPCEDWTLVTAQFDYSKQPADVEGVTELQKRYMLASFTTNPNPGQSAGDELTIDDVVLLYYSQLSDLKYDGQAIAGFDKDTYAYDLSSVEYDATKSVEYTKTGVGSTVETSYDEATAVLTLTVKGNDYSADNQNQHVYTVQFKKPAVAALQAVKVCGVDLADFNAETTDYTLPYAYHQDVVVAATPADGTTVGEAVYNDETKTITLTATNGDATRDYTFRFTETVANDQAGTYPGALSVVLTTGGVDQPTALANAPVELTFNADGTANLTLNDFKFFGGMILVGDIYVPGLPVVDGKISGTRTIRLTAFDENGKKDDTAYGWMLGNLPVKVEASIIGDKQIAAGIDIITSETILASMFENIHVDLEPMEVSGELQDDGHYPGLTVTGRVTKKGASLLGIGSKPLSGEYPMQYIDLSGATIDSDVTRDDIFTIAPSKNNTLVYAPAGSTLTGDNIIVGDQCAKLALTESAEFFAPKAFTAAEVSLDRDFTTDGVNTFVLPFGFDVPADMKVYELTGVEGTVLNFSDVDAVKANQPYLIETASARPFDALTDVEVAATEAADRTVDGFTHHGTFVTEEVKSGETTYYGWNADNTFVKATSGTLNPFRTLISTTATNAAAAYSIRFDKPTGIDSVESTTTDKVIYDLTGRRVEKATKGLYIINGKKVIIR